MGISIEEARLRVASANPGLSSAEIRQQADNLIAKLSYIEAEDAMRASYAAQQAEEQAQQAIEAQRREEAFADAQSVVRSSHPGWSAESVDMEAARLAAENAAALAAMDLREALAEGFDK